MREKHFSTCLLNKMATSDMLIETKANQKEMNIDLPASSEKIGGANAYFSVSDMTSR
jgi:hypothetical protein